MTGAFLNALGILIGSLFGLAGTAPVTPRAQIFFRNAIGALTVFFGLRLIYENVSGTFGACFKQLGITALSLVLGYWVGKLLGFQKMSNRLGRFATTLMSRKSTHKKADGLNACSILFCAAPLGILGAVADGLTGYFYLLAVKAAMDGLAMTSFSRLFGWTTSFAAFAVFAFFGGIALVVQMCALPFLEAHGLTASVNAAAGLLACVVALVIFELRRVELANYLPALALAPLLAHWL